MLKRQSSPFSCSVEAKKACDCPNLFSNFSWGTRVTFSLPISYEIWESISTNTLKNINVRKKKGTKSTHQLLPKDALA
jgi:hypothetical protein